MKLIIIFIMLSILLFNILNCSKENSLQPQPQNRSPEILSLDVFPDVIGPSDSVIVICQAIDPDGDTLVYDWITDGRVRIKGTNYHRLFHTSENTRVFYPTEYVNTPLDTCWIQAFARDVKGGSVAEVVRFMVNQDLRR